MDADGVANGWIPRTPSVHPLQKARASPCRGMTPWPPEGRTAWDPLLETEGFAAGSRWLSEATPPVTDPHHPPHPGGVPAQSRPRRWHPCRDAGVHVRTGPRWCRRFAPRPPATRWEASGFMADGRRGHLGCGHPRACRGRPSATMACWHEACGHEPACGSGASHLLAGGFGTTEHGAGTRGAGGNES